MPIHMSKPMQCVARVTLGALLTINMGFSTLVSAKQDPLSGLAEQASSNEHNEGFSKNRPSRSEEHKKRIKQLSETYRSASPDQLVSHHGGKVGHRKASFNPNVNGEVNDSEFYRKCNFNCQREQCISLNYVQPNGSLSSDVYSLRSNQFGEYISSSAILEFVTPFIHDTSIVVPGSEADDSAPVYGYDEDGNLLRDGGRSNSYSLLPNYLKSNYHSNAQDRDFYFLKTDYLKSISDHFWSYFLERGYPLPTNDIAPGFEEVFIYTGGSPFGAFDNGFISIKMNYADDDTSIPSSVDLVAQDGVIGQLALYEPDGNQYKNSHYYPMRIPVTTDFCGEFQAKYDVEPIAYWDQRSNNITIHVPDNGVEYEMGHELIDLSQYDLGDQYQIYDYLVAFHGTFELVKRHPGNNKLIDADRADVMYLIQTSDNVTAKSRTYYSENNQDFVVSDSVNSFDAFDNNAYTGIAFNKSGNQNGGFDYYVVPGEFVGSNYVWVTDPVSIGDLPMSQFTETFSSNTIMVLDDLAAIYTTYETTDDVYNGSVYPEEITDPTRVPGLVFNPYFAVNIVKCHEHFHVAQFAGGFHSWVTPESWAMAGNFDRKANTGINAIYTGNRSVGSAILAMASGRHTPLGPESANLSYPYSGFFSWLYFINQFDKNYQLPRRIQDILTEQYTQPLQDANINFDYYNPISATANNLAMDQALRELFDKNYPDVFTDLAISLAFVRNNTAIPEQYRHTYPYWLWNKDYPDAQSELANTWWSSMNDNDYVYDYPAGTKKAYYPQLVQQQSIQSEDMRMFLYEVPENATFINLNVVNGDWRVSVVNFVSDGTAAGQFDQLPSVGQASSLSDGQSIQYDLTQLNRPVGGSTRLVVANVGLNDQGGLSNAYDHGAITGQISIESDAIPSKPASAGLSLKVSTSDGTLVKEYRARYFNGDSPTSGLVGGVLTVEGVNVISGADRTADGCDSISQDVGGKIALMKRGSCTFALKVQNAFAGNAVASIIFNRDPGVGIGEFAPVILNYTIPKPAIFMTYEDGMELTEFVNQGGYVITLSDPVQSP